MYSHLLSNPYAFCRKGGRSGGKKDTMPWRKASETMIQNQTFHIEALFQPVVLATLSEGRKMLTERTAVTTVTVVMRMRRDKPGEDGAGASAIMPEVLTVTLGMTWEKASQLFHLWYIYVWNNWRRFWWKYLLFFWHQFYWVYWIGPLPVRCP